MVQDFDLVPRSGGPAQSIAIQDRRRLIGDAVLENPVMFTFNQSTWQPGVPLDPTMMSSIQRATISQLLVTTLATELKFAFKCVLLVQCHV